ncbi:ABC transporter ATP-binding protein [Zhihengliuella flava]|uniref:ATP-binding cassette subfamily B protein n=1 Tax=Zhihengliuella flava TaxID=1285193 RepID=A0A931GEJ7_9MICC|nr:ABC transporter ATP-binding protein [Zhihengliuella flava]MBG6084185.1 ATP-binding cassette subfamily B protein [Zhihengliuella flava]
MSIGVADEDHINLDAENRRRVRRRSLRLLKALAGPLKWRLIGTALLVLVSAGSRAALPLLVAWAIDTMLPRVVAGDYAALGFAGGAYIGTALLAGGFLGLYTYAAAAVSQAMLLDLRLRVFRHTQLLSLEFHETYTSGRVISRQTSDLETLRELLDQGMSQLVSGLAFILFTAISMFILDWQTALVVIGAAVPIAVIFRWYQVRSELVYRESRVISARVITTFVETMTGIRAVKAFRREQASDENYTDIAHQYRDNTLRTISLFGVLQPTLMLIGNLTVAAVLLIGGFRVLDGSLEIGALVGLLLTAKRVFQPVEAIAMFYNSFQAATAALEKVSGLLEEVPTVVEPERPRQLTHAAGRVEFSDAVFGYGSGPVVMDRFSLTIEAGQTVAVVGQTGAGKSTLAKLIARFYDLSEGTLTLDGVDLRELSQRDLRRAVVMVTQEAFLFSGSVAENIALGKPNATREEVILAARAVGVHEFIESLPEGYDTDVNKRGGRVSAGQRQLISFARAFLADPSVLILDEATSSLDIPSERAVQAALARLLGERTAVIIAHRLSTVEIADRVLVVHDGKIVEDGSPAELVAAGGRFAALHAAWQDSLT